MKKYIAILLTIGFLSGCSELTPGGKKVVLADDFTGDNMNAMVKVGKVNCRNVVYFTTETVNRRLCVERLRSQAHELGAEVITVDQVIELPGFLNTGVEMLGTAYKRSR